jgi:L-asparaginase
MEGSTDMHIEDVGLQALKAGAIQAYDMSIESVVTKLMWALKHFPYRDIEEAIHTNYTGEINVKGKIS